MLAKEVTKYTTNFSARHLAFIVLTLSEPILVFFSDGQLGAVVLKIVHCVTIVVPQMESWDQLFSKQ